MERDSDRGKEQARMVFVHIPKSAGTSFNLLLEKLHSPESSFIMGDYFYPDCLKNENGTLFSGHMFLEEVGPSLPENSLLMTFLRNPLERALSHFSFLKLDSVAQTFEANRHRYATHRFRWGAELIGKIREMSLLDFLKREEKWVQFALANLQTRILGGKEGFEPVTRADLDRARKNLERFFFVGILEKMNPSLDQFCRLCRLPPIELEKANINPERTALEDIGSEVRDLLSRANEFDRELYQFGLELFERQKGREPLTVTNLGKAEDFRVSEPFIGRGWYPREKDGDSWFIWSGPQQVSWLEISTELREECRLTCEFRFLIHEDVLKDLKLFCNGQMLDYQVVREDHKVNLVSRVGAPILNQEKGRIRLAFDSQNHFRPDQLDPTSLDNRELGFALERIQLTKGSSLQLVTP